MATQQQPAGDFKAGKAFAEQTHPSTQIFDKIHDKFFRDPAFQREILQKGRKYRIVVNNDQSNVDYYLQCLTVDDKIHPKQIVSKNEEPNGITDAAFQITDKDLSAVTKGEKSLRDLYNNGSLKVKGNQIEELQSLDELEKILQKANQ